VCIEFFCELYVVNNCQHVHCVCAISFIRPMKRRPIKARYTLPVQTARSNG